MAIEAIVDATSPKNSFIVDVTATSDASGVPLTGIRFYNIHDISGLSNENETSEMHVGGTDATAWIVGVKKKGDVTIKRFCQKRYATDPGYNAGNSYFRDWRKSVTTGAQASQFMRPVRILKLDKSYMISLAFLLKSCYPSRVEWDDMGAEDSGVWMETFVLKISDIDWAEADSATVVSLQPADATKGLRDEIPNTTANAAYIPVL